MFYKKRIEELERKVRQLEEEGMFLKKIGDKKVYNPSFPYDNNMVFVKTKDLVCMIVDHFELKYKDETKENAKLVREREVINDHP